jgi:hypothetical protein
MASIFIQLSFVILPNFHMKTQKILAFFFYNLIPYVNLKIFVIKFLYKIFTKCSSIEITNQTPDKSERESYSNVPFCSQSSFLDITSISPVSFWHQVDRE